MLQGTQNRETCSICGAGLGAVRLDLGPQPICSNLLVKPDDSWSSHPCTLAQCDRCGTVQLAPAPPFELLVSPRGPVSYREPERHLDGVADLLATLPGLGEGKGIAGISPKDDTLLARLRDRGVPGTWRIEMVRDAGVENPRAGNESLQASCTPHLAHSLVARRGKPSLAIARHIFEHASDPGAFLAFLRELVEPGGYVLLEIPDCARQLAVLDYTMVWEDHHLYLTPDALELALTLAGFRPVNTQRHSYPSEDCITVLARAENAVPGKWPSAEALAVQRSSMRRYVSSFPERRAAVRKSVARMRGAGKVAVFGAGHLACAFINIFGLPDLLECVLDDDPSKQNLYLPGSRLPIRPSAILESADIRTCLMGINPENEAKLQANHRCFTEKGGAFMSIFPSSPFAMPL